MYPYKKRAAIDRLKKRRLRYRSGRLSTKASLTSSNDRTIMVVDDDDDVRTMVGEILRRSGYDVVGAANGQDAQPLALKTLPALIIMDIGMPETDGLTTLWEMRKHDELSTVPVIILTAYESYDLREEAASTGCKGYLTKPFEPVELKELVNTLLPLNDSLVQG